MGKDNSKRYPVGDHVTIYPRGKTKIYCADFWHAGKHHRKSLETRNLKIARQRALKIEVQLVNGEYRSPLKPTAILTGIESYITYLETEGRRRKTTVRYRGILLIFQGFATEQGVERLAQTTPVLIDRFRAERKKVLAQKSMRNEGVLLKSFFKWCMQRRFVTQNPLEEMTFKKPSSKPRGGPSMNRSNEILNSAAKQRRIQFAVLSFTGMRSGELRRLKPEDVDLTNNWIHVVSREGDETKTGFSRKVPIHERLLPFLTEMPSRARPWFFTASPSPKYRCGNHSISTKHLNEDFLKILTRLNIPAGRKDGFTAHSLRSSFETICVNAGIPQRVVDTWLGHRSDTSMASVYYRLSDQDSQHFMKQVPFGTGDPSAEDNEREC